VQLPDEAFAARRLGSSANNDMGRRVEEESTCVTWLYTTSEAMIEDGRDEQGREG
jgi:hypothetical protein